MDKQLKLAESEKVKMLEDAERKAKEKADKHEEFQKKMEEHKKTMSLRIRNVQNRKSVSQMGTKKKLDEEDSDNAPA